MPIVLNGSGPITGVTSLNTTVSDTEIGYLDGVTSALQTQLAGKADTTGNGAWTSWTPTVSGLTTGNGTMSAAYLQLGKLVVIRFGFTLGSTSAVTGDLNFPLPVNRTTSLYETMASQFTDATAGEIPSLATIAGTNPGTLYVRAINVAGTYAAAVPTTATIPFTWTTGDRIAVSGIYEAA